MCIIEIEDTWKDNLENHLYCSIQLNIQIFSNILPPTLGHRSLPSLSNKKSKKYFSRERQTDKQLCHLLCSSSCLQYNYPLYHIVPFHIILISWLYGILWKNSEMTMRCPGIFKWPSAVVIDWHSKISLRIGVLAAFGCICLL